MTPLLAHSCSTTACHSAGVKHFIESKLGISPQALPHQEVRRRVAASRFANDYYITPDYVRNVRVADSSDAAMVTRPPSDTGSAAIVVRP